MQGLQATAVTIEVNATRGVRFVLVGLPDNAVKESHERQSDTGIPPCAGGPFQKRTNW